MSSDPKKSIITTESPSIEEQPATSPDVVVLETEELEDIAGGMMGTNGACANANKCG